MLDRAVCRTAFACLSDAELDRLADEFIAAAARARRRLSASSTSSSATATSDTSCSARARAADRYGGSLENRTRFHASRRRRHPRAGSRAGRSCVRLSVFDTVPYRKRGDGVGEAERRAAGSGDWGTGDWDSFGFGVLESDDQPRRGARRMPRRARRCWSSSASAGSARPAAVRTTTRTSSGRRSFPPLDGYEPPEDPLRGVRAADSGDGHAEAAISADWCSCGSAYSYLQEWLPHVGQHTVRDGLTRLRRPRPHRAVVSRSAGRRAGGRAAQARGFLPHVQRLHHRSAHGAGVRVLSARHVLRGAAGSGEIREVRARDTGLGLEGLGIRIETDAFARSIV